MSSVPWTPSLVHQQEECYAGGTPRDLLATNLVGDAEILHRLHSSELASPADQIDSARHRTLCTTT